MQRALRKEESPDTSIGTYGILRLLMRFSAMSGHALYQTELKRLTVVPITTLANAIIRRIWKPVAAIAFVTLMLAVVDFFCAGTQRNFSSQLFSICTLVIGTLILLGILLFTYLWPLPVAIASSSVIVHERERQTWETLLTTALDRRDIIMIKMAAALSPFRLYGEMVIWVQLFVMILIFVLLVAQFSTTAGRAPMTLWEIPLLFFTMIEFAIARIQDFVLAVLIGLITSLLAPTRQTAGSVALMAGIALVLIRALLTVAIAIASEATSIPLQGVPGMFILLSTGPSSVITLAWRGLFGTAILVCMIVAREGLIRFMFKWLIQNLGESNTAEA